MIEELNELRLQMEKNYQELLKLANVSNEMLENAKKFQKNSQEISRALDFKPDWKFHENKLKNAKNFLDTSVANYQKNFNKKKMAPQYLSNVINNIEEFKGIINEAETYLEEKKNQNHNNSQEKNKPNEKKKLTKKVSANLTNKKKKVSEATNSTLKKAKQKVSFTQDSETKHNTRVDLLNEYLSAINNVCNNILTPKNDNKIVEPNVPSKSLNINTDTKPLLHRSSSSSDSSSSSESDDDNLIEEKAIFEEETIKLNELTQQSQSFTRASKKQSCCSGCFNFFKSSNSNRNTSEAEIDDNSNADLLKNVVTN